MDSSLPAYERLGLFYLGRGYDPASASTSSTPILYDSRDLTTHALCVGMTGSGKTGLCLALLEEAAIDGIPAIAVDPKGDLGNLLLTFPQLRPADFQPWIDPQDAARRKLSPEERAQQVAETWKAGLAQWDQDGARIGRFRESADAAIYTPGSSAGLPLAVMRNLSAPSAEVIADGDAFLDRVSGTAQGLLTLLGIDADPTRSREFILLSNILDDAWRLRLDLPLGELMRRIQSPPFAQIGLLDVETVLPARDRAALAMRLNNLVASPAFQPWMVGEPLDAERLLYTPEGRPRLSIISIAHLNDQERMFFVTLLLYDVLRWMRSQPGTSSLRAILYMDEIFGFFPPSAAPPSKRPMLTLLKQARAFGLGVVLSTQNPVDLDYKGLANCGTWFLGRLQTARDKERVLAGLRGTAAESLQTLGHESIEQMLSSLGNRVFLLHNVHQDHTVLFQSRWALSYLAGPLSGPQIRRLMDRRRATADLHPRGMHTPPGPATVDLGHQAPATAWTRVAASGKRPIVPAGVREFFVPCDGAADGRKLIYRPVLLGRIRLHFVSSREGLDRWEERTLLSLDTAAPGPDPWANARRVAHNTVFEATPSDGAEFAPLPTGWTSPSAVTAWTRALKAHAERSITYVLAHCPALKIASNGGESEAQFRARAAIAAREARDAQIDTLRSRFALRFSAQQERIRLAQQRLDREKSQLQDHRWQSAMQVGSSLLGALLGNRLASRTNVTRAATSMRSMGRTAKEKEDVTRAQENLYAAMEKLKSLEEEFERAAEKIERAAQPASLVIERKLIRPRKSDLEVELVALAWVPWTLDPAGQARPAYNIPFLTE